MACLAPMLDRHNRRAWPGAARGRALSFPRLLRLCQPDRRGVPTTYHRAGAVQAASSMPDTLTHPAGVPAMPHLLETVPSTKGSRADKFSQGGR
jgi:hypothetical protein